MMTRPINADGPYRVQRADGHHDQAFHEGWAVRIMRDARVLIDVLDDRGLPVEHGPAADAGVQRKAASLPQWADGVFFRIEALVTIAKHEGRAVGTDEIARGMAHDLHD